MMLSLTPTAFFHRSWQRHPTRASSPGRRLSFGRKQLTRTSACDISDMSHSPVHHVDYSQTQLRLALLLGAAVWQTTGPSLQADNGRHIRPIRRCKRAAPGTGGSEASHLLAASTIFIDVAAAGTTARHNSLSTTSSPRPLTRLSPAMVSPQQVLWLPWNRYGQCRSPPSLH